jgi:hypothetical protein
MLWIWYDMKRRVAVELRYLGMLEGTSDSM